MSRFAVATFAAVCLAGCSDNSGGAEPVGWVEVHIAKEKSLTPELTIEFEGTRFALQQPGLRVAVASLRDRTDDMGQPEIDVTLAEPDAQLFADWTAAHVDELMAVCARGQVFSIGIINGRLPGAFCIPLHGAEPARVEAVKAAIATDR